MTRVMSICLGLLICFGGSAWAGDKPRVGVLGLEAAAGPNGAVDAGAQLAAREITKELRERVQAPTSPYVVAPNSNKELLDEKLLMSCENEEVECMVVIGAGLATDVLIYGRIDKKGDSFRVSLKLLDIKKRQVQSAVDDVPIGGAVDGVSRRLYNKLIGEPLESRGTLVVRARSEAGGAVRGGSVKVDDQLKGQLAGGKLTIPEVPAGRRTVAIEAPGYRRFEEAVTVRSGDPVKVDAVLRPIVVAQTPPVPPDKPPAPPPPSPTPSGGRSPLWKWSLGAGIATGVAAGLAGGAYAFYSLDRMNKHNALIDAKTTGDPSKISVGTDDCGTSEANLRNDKMLTQLNYHELQRTCTWRSHITWGIVTASVGGAVAITSLILLTRDPGPSENPATGTRGKKSDLAIVPIVTPELAGAELAFRW